MHEETYLNGSSLHKNNRDEKKNLKKYIYCKLQELASKME